MNVLKSRSEILASLENINMCIIIGQLLSYRTITQLIEKHIFLSQLFYFDLFKWEM